MAGTGITPDKGSRGGVTRARDLQMALKQNIQFDSCWIRNVIQHCQRTARPPPCLTSSGRRPQPEPRPGASPTNWPLPMSVMTSTRPPLRNQAGHCAPQASWTEYKLPNRAVPAVLRQAGLGAWSSHPCTLPRHWSEAGRPSGRPALSPRRSSARQRCPRLARSTAGH